MNSKSTLLGAFVNPGKSTSDPRGRHSNPSGNVPRYLNWMLDTLQSHPPGTQLPYYMALIIITYNAF